MLKIKQITSLLAVVAVLFGFATESFAAKKSKTLNFLKEKYLIKMLKRFYLKKERIVAIFGMHTVLLKHLNDSKK